MCVCVCCYVCVCVCSVFVCVKSVSDVRNPSPMNIALWPARWSRKANLIRGHGDAEVCEDEREREDDSENLMRER